MAKEKGIKRVIDELVPSFRDELGQLYQEIRSKAGSDRLLAIQFAASNFGEGVTTLTLGFALFLASVHRGQDVLVVEGNVRKPSLRNLFKIPGTVGFQSVLNGNAEIEDAIVRVANSDVSLIPAEDSKGSDDALSGEYIGDLLKDFFYSCKGRFRFVLVDGPPVIPYVDSSLLAAAADGVVFLIESNRTRSEVVDVALDKLKSGGAKVLGTVLNKRQFHIPNFVYRFL